MIRVIGCKITITLIFTSMVSKELMYNRIRSSINNQMASKKDLYLELCKSSEMMLGRIVDRENILAALRQTISEDDLRFYFLLPGNYTYLMLDKIISKARHIGATAIDTEAALERLYREAFVLRYNDGSGLKYMRAYLSMTAEQQVRMKKDTLLGKAYAEYWRDLAQKSARVLPTRTPYFRILPVETTLQKNKQMEIRVDVAVPDPREVLPLDIASEIVKSQILVGIAECYCRASRDFQGYHCLKPRETCFVFNDFASSLIDLGVARRLTNDEAIAILKDCEKHGLVHNVDNFQGQIRGMCNCCSDCCPGMEAAARGQKNIEAPSRFTVNFDQIKCTRDHACISACPIGAISKEDDFPVFNGELCFGCGLCVSACPQTALHMKMRERIPYLPKSARELTNRMMVEAMTGVVIRSLKK
jgi:Fe-S-cluster-containing hydrogenase component 2